MGIRVYLTRISVIFVMPKVEPDSEEQHIHIHIEQNGSGSAEKTAAETSDTEETLKKPRSTLLWLLAGLALLAVLFGMVILF